MRSAPSGRHWTITARATAEEALAHPPNPLVDDIDDPQAQLNSPPSRAPRSHSFLTV